MEASVVVRWKGVEGEGLRIGIVVYDVFGET